MLDECLGYLEEKAKQDGSFTYEVIIVDDGSRDKTTQVGLDYSKKLGCDKIRVLTLAKNRGKGGAVRMVCWCDASFCLFLWKIQYFVEIYVRINIL